MKKTVSKRKAQERREMLRKSKKHALVLALSIIPPFVASVVFIILYALKISYAWLSATTFVLWLALGGLFVYAYRKKWGFVNSKGVKAQDNSSIVTIYNIVLVFALALFFLVMTLYKIF